MEQYGAVTRCSSDVFAQYTTNYKRAAPIAQKSAFVGNNLKSLHNSVKASLKKLRTDYIDILYVHWVRCFLASPSDYV